MSHAPRFGTAMSGVQVHAESVEYPGRAACDRRVMLDVSPGVLTSVGEWGRCQRSACKRWFSVLDKGRNQ